MLFELTQDGSPIIGLKLDSREISFVETHHHFHLDHNTQQALFVFNIQGKLQSVLPIHDPSVSILSIQVTSGILAASGVQASHAYVGVYHIRREPLETLDFAWERTFQADPGLSAKGRSAVPLSDGRIAVGGTTGFIHVPSGSKVKPGKALLIEYSATGGVLRSEAFGEKRNNQIACIRVTSDGLVFGAAALNGWITHDAPADQHSTSAIFQFDF